MAVTCSPSRDVSPDTPPHRADAKARHPCQHAPAPTVAHPSGARGPDIRERSDDSSQVQAAVTAKYDREAKGYDRARAGLFFELAGEIVADMAGPCEGLAILDVPVGTGRIMPHLKGASGAARYVGADIAPGMARVARRTAANQGIRAYGGTLASLWKLPFASQQFDLVLILRLFHLFPTETWADALREVHRVLKPGGSVIAEMRNRHRGIAVGALRRWLDARNPRELPHYYVRPGELDAIFGDLRIVETRGYWFDGSQLFKHVARAPAHRINVALSTGPLRFLSSELVVKATKDG